MNAAQTPATALQHRHHRHDHPDHSHHGHAHDGPGHAGQGHGGHAHAGHHPTHDAREGATPVVGNEAHQPIPRFSLIALSGSQRLAFAFPAIAILWLLAFWAMTNG